MTPMATMTSMPMTRKSCPRGPRASRLGPPGQWGRPGLLRWPATPTLPGAPAAAEREPGPAVTDGRAHPDRGWARWPICRDRVYSQCGVGMRGGNRRLEQRGARAEQAHDGLAVVDIALLSPAARFRQRQPVHLDQFTFLQRHFDRIQPTGEVQMHYFRKNSG